MREWAKEPWHSDLYEGAGAMLNACVRATSPTSPPVAYFGDRDDSDRAVACVNALAGVPKPDGITGLLKAIRYYFHESGDTPCHVSFQGDEEVHAALRACGIES